MDDLSELIREYVAILDAEQKLDTRKNELRKQIAALLEARELRTQHSPFGTAQRRTRFSLRPLREPILALLDAADLFPFASFTSQRVRTELVPKYGRERLLPLFEIKQTEYLQITRPKGPQATSD